MKRVIIETPYAARDAITLARNIEYARACMVDCFKRGEAPFAPHLLYTQPGILRDKERSLGIDAGLLWGECAELAAVYSDLGFTAGMQMGTNRARSAKRLVVRRTLAEWPTPQAIEIVSSAMSAECPTCDGKCAMVTPESVITVCCTPVSNTVIDMFCPACRALRVVGHLNGYAHECVQHMPYDVLTVL